MFNLLERWRDEGEFRLEFYFTRVSYLSVDDRRFDRVWCWFGMVFFFFLLYSKRMIDRFFPFQSNLLRELLLFSFWKILKILNFKMKLLCNYWMFLNVFFFFFMADVTLFGKKYASLNKFLRSICIFVVNNGIEHKYECVIQL